MKQLRPKHSLGNSVFEWVILFKKPTVNVFIGNYIRRVTVIERSLYSRLYGIGLLKKDIYILASVPKKGSSMNNPIYRMTYHNITAHFLNRTTPQIQ